MNVSIDRANAWLASPLRRVGFFLVAGMMMMRGVAQAQCGSNPDFIVLPDGSGTPEIVFVINNTVSGTGPDSGGIGNIIMGTPDGTVSQTQTLRITSTGHVIPDNSDACSTDTNTAAVTVEKTGVVDMQGGSLEPVNLNIAGPVAGDNASGGALRGFGTVKAAGGDFAAFDLQRTLLNPTGGILSLDASRVVSGATVQDQIQLGNSTLRVQIGGSTTTYLNIVKGAVTFTNTKLVVDFPAGFTATAGQVFLSSTLGS